MKLIIVGAGKVGFSLAANLCQEGHGVTVIDTDRQRLDLLEEHLNVSTVNGNAAKLEILAAADAANTDLIIAVTDKDELNMVTCFLARQAGVKSAVARVRAPGYSDLNNSQALDALGVDMLINPERVTAAEIAKLIEYPEASFVSYFGGGELIMLELRLSRTCLRLGQQLKTLSCPVPCIVVGIQRQGQLLIPRGDDRLLAGDEVLLLSATKDIRRVEDYLGVAPRRPRSIAILSGALTGYYLAEMLDKGERRYNVKLFEPDRQRGQELATGLNRTAIIHAGAGAAISMFDDENVGESDLLIAASEDDKDNLFASVVAHHLGVGKTIAQIRGEYAPLIERAGVDKVVSPNRLTLDTILRFINRTRILSLTRFDDSPGQITEFLVAATAPAAGSSIMALDFPVAAIICMIIRGERHIIPSGRDLIEPGDVIIVFSLPQALGAVEELFAAAENGRGGAEAQS